MSCSGCRSLACSECARSSIRRSKRRARCGGFLGRLPVYALGAPLPVIAFGAAGALDTVVVITNNATPSYPSGITAGQLLVAFIWGQYSGASPSFAASGWTAAPGGGLIDATTGLFALPYYKVATGSESGAETFVGSGGISHKPASQIYRYTTTGRGGWSLSGSSWSPVAATNHSLLCGSIDIKIRDIVLCFYGTSAAATVSAEGMSASGVTFAAAVERLDNAGISPPAEVAMTEHLITAGLTTNQMTYTATTTASCKLIGGPLRLRGL